MGYCEAMKAAGAKVHAYKEFGSYQGDWWAKVTYKKKTFWVHGSYGSCTGCDAFLAEFDYDDYYGGRCEEHSYDATVRKCAGCKSKQKEVKVRMAKFGASYLTGYDLTQKEAEKQASKEMELYGGDEEQLDFLKENALS